MNYKVNIICVLITQCLVQASIPVSTSTFIQNVHMSLDEIKQFENIDDAIRDVWDYLRTRVDRDTIKVLKSENLQIQASLYAKLKHVENLIAQMGSEKQVCGNVNYQSFDKNQTVEPVANLWSKLLAMKQDVEDCKKIGGSEFEERQSVLKKTLMVRCLRKNNRKHRWELAPAVDKVADVYLHIKSIETQLILCNEAFVNIKH